MSTAFNIFLKKVIATKGIPFSVSLEDEFSKYEQEILKETKEAIKNGKRYSSVDEMWKDILGEEEFKKKILSKRK